LLITHGLHTATLGFFYTCRSTESTPAK